MHLGTENYTEVVYFSIQCKILGLADILRDRFGTL
jgi:hypothetical protein